MDRRILSASSIHLEGRSARFSKPKCLLAEVLVNPDDRKAVYFISSLSSGKMNVPKHIISESQQASHRQCHPTGVRLTAHPTRTAMKVMIMQCQQYPEM